MTRDSTRAVAAWRAVLEALLQATRGSLEAGELRSLAGWLEREAERLEDGAPIREGTAAGARPPEAAEAPGAAAEEESGAVVTRALKLGGRVVEVPVTAGSQGEPAGAQAARGSSAERRQVIHERAVPERHPLPAPRKYVARQRDWAEAFGSMLASLDLKVEACKAVLEHGRGSNGAGFQAERARLIAEAKLLGNCWLWPLDPAFDGAEDWQVDLSVRCYENLASAVRVVQLDREWLSLASQPPEDLLFTVAEVQSALRSALLDLGIRDDYDQNSVYHWLRAQGEEHSLFIPRFMRVEDPADAGNWEELAGRLEMWRARVERRVEEAGASKEGQRLLNKLRYEVGKLREATTDAERMERWSTILRTLDEWIEGGRPPSNRDVCELLLDLADEIPDELEISDNVTLVLRAIDSRIAQMESAEAKTPDEPERQLGPQVLEARRLLADRVLLLIGGERRAREQERLRRDLGLREVRWISTKAHRSISPLIDAIEKPDVDLVVVLKRFSDHAFSDLKDPATSAGKVFVNARGGYGSERMAHEILLQASGKLGGEPPR